MATKSKSDTNSKFQELFLHELKDIYWAEKHLVKALPKMSKGATSEKLSKAIDNHIQETEMQIERLEQVFEMMGEKASGKKCQAMAGLLEEGEEMLKESKLEGLVKDAGIIISSQKIEHYEIAAYGSLVTLAQKLGMNDAAKLLEQTLNEEKKTDELLTTIAETEVNVKAMNE
jgi:ferritin-like metal-binding protein YciE